MLSFGTVRVVTRQVVLAVLLAVIACMIPSTAWADNVMNVDINDPATVFDNPCVPPAGEPVVVSGVIHIVITTTADGAGGYHTHIGSNESFSGQGLVTRVSYHGSDLHEYDYDAHPPFPQATTDVMGTDLITQGGTIPKFHYHWNLHVTVNAHGIPTATVDNYHLDCAG